MIIGIDAHVIEGDRIQVPADVLTGKGIQFKSIIIAVTDRGIAKAQTGRLLIVLIDGPLIITDNCIINRYNTVSPSMDIAPVISCNRSAVTDICPHTIIPKRRQHRLRTKAISISNNQAPINS